MRWWVGAGALTVAGCAAVSGLGNFALVDDAPSTPDEAGTVSVVDAAATPDVVEPPAPIVAVCGDGHLAAPEECDDGNTASGDGCSANCKAEPGYHCTTEAIPATDTLTIPITYRDMRFAGTPHGHPDFNPPAIKFEQGLVQAQADAQGKPVFRQAGATCTTPENLCWWFHETGCSGAGSVNPYSHLITTASDGKPTTIALKRVGQDLVEYANTDFFPIDGLGWDATDGVQTDPSCAAPAGANFSFTSELHLPFLYTGSETLMFAGDDDVWVFINGHLAIDIGGIHNAATGSIALADQAMNRCVKETCDTVAMADLGLALGAAADLAVFQAERHVCSSNYTLSLTSFTPSRTTCSKE